MAHKPSCRLHTRISRLFHLGAQGQFGGFGSWHDEPVFYITGGETDERSLATVSVNELAKEFQREPILLKLVCRIWCGHYDCDNGIT